jgi:CHASE3 domain sensor protein
MKSLALRLTLLGLFVAAAGVAAYFSWTGVARARQEAGAFTAFDGAAVGAERDVLELRAAQQGYVAAGQGEELWASKVDGGVSKLRETLNSLRTRATTPAAQAAIDSASSALQDFEQTDRRARDYARTSQNLLASDLIFANGFELTAAAASAVEDARSAERQAHESSAAGIEIRNLAAAGGAMAAGLFIIALLVPRGAEPAPVPDLIKRPIPRFEGAKPSARIDTGTSTDEGWSAAKVVPKAKPVSKPATVAPSAAPARAAAPAASRAVARADAPAVDLPSVASLCGDLARVVDTHALPALLERAAAVLDASGIVLWIADPDGREMSPIVTHGYPQQLVSRLGTILRDAENATASAFRTALLQTVTADAVSNGAIAAPLVTPTGCVGVMAAEVRNHGEKNAAKLAVATIVAAQLATLVGPPSARAQARVEAGAGASA